MRDNIFLKSFCITFAVLMFMACGGGGGGGGGGGDNSSPNIALSETNHDFSGVVKNSSADHTFEITNTGNANLSIGQISGLAAPYSIPAASDACSNQTLGPSGTCTFRARFEPTDHGVFADQISIPSNDPSGTTTIGLLGEGYDLNVWIKNASVAACVVDVGVTVTDDAGNILDNGDLDPNNDFSFYVDGIAAAPANVTFDTYETPSPVSVVLAIDCSTSEGGVLTQIENAAISFINQLDDADEAAICQFKSTREFYPDPEIFYDLATHRADLINYIDNNLSAASGTYLYDAIYESIDWADQGDIANKHIVVVLSDGVDTGSTHTLNQVIARAEEKGVIVFTIYYRDPDYGSGDYGDPDILRQAADGSDGQDYDGMTGGLDTVYYKIVSTIRNKFIFELTVPGCTPGTASLDVVVDTGVLYGQDSTTITFP